MKYLLSKLPDIDVLKPDDTVILDYRDDEKTLLYHKCMMLIRQHMAIWHGYECVELSNDIPGEKPTHYHTLYFRPSTPKHNLIGVSPLSDINTLLSKLKK